MKKISLSQLDASIIRYLISCQDYCTSYDIAMNVGINRRQIRSEINIIKDILDDLGYTLDSKRSKGYFILERSELGFLQELLDNNNFSQPELLSPVMRRNYAIQMLVTNDSDYMRLDDLADALYVSRSTINNDLASQVHRMGERGLALDFKKRGGVRLTGSELAKREIYCDALFNNISNAKTFYSYLDMFTNPDAKLESSIIETLQRYTIQMSDTAMCDFLLYLSIVCMRLAQGKTLLESPDMSLVRNRSEFDVARIIGALLSSYLGVMVNEHEINRIGIKLITKRSSSLIPNVQFNAEALLISRKCIDAIYSRTRISFHNKEFVTVFEQYIYTTYVTVSYGEKVRNPLYNEMQENYPVAYDLALIVSDVFKQHIGRRLSSSHIAFYTTFFNTWIARIKTQRLPVLLICGMGMGAMQSVREQLIVDLGSRIEIADTCMYYQLKDMDLTKYAFVISTMPIPKTLPLPTITISQFILQDDIQKIIDFLSTYFSSFRPLYVMTPSMYAAGVKAQNLTDALHVMADNLCHIFTKLKPSYVESILSAEQNIINILPNHIALIKISKPISSHSLIYTLVLQKPIIHNGETIRIILMVSSVNKTISLFTAMQEECISVRREDVIAFTASQKPYPEFISMLLNASKNE